MGWERERAGVHRQAVGSRGAWFHLFPFAWWTFVASLGVVVNHTHFKSGPCLQWRVGFYFISRFEIIFSHIYGCDGHVLSQCCLLTYVSLTFYSLCFFVFVVCCLFFLPLSIRKTSICRLTGSLGITAFHSSAHVLISYLTTCVSFIRYLLHRKYLFCFPTTSLLFPLYILYVFLTFYFQIIVDSQEVVKIWQRSSRYPLPRFPQ